MDGLRWLNPFDTNPLPEPLPENLPTYLDEYGRKITVCPTRWADGVRSDHRVKPGRGR